MYCKKCGMEMSSDDSFCGKCGTKVIANKEVKINYEIEQIQRGFNVKSSFWGYAKLDGIEDEINKIINEYENIKYMDLKFDIIKGQLRRVKLSIDLVTNTTLTYRYKVKHFIGRGSGQKSGFSVRKTDFDEAVNNYSRENKIRIRQTRSINNFGVETDRFIVYSEFK